MKIRVSKEKSCLALIILFIIRTDTTDTFILAYIAPSRLEKKNLAQAAVVSTRPIRGAI